MLQKLLNYKYPNKVLIV